MGTAGNVDLNSCMKKIQWMTIDHILLQMIDNNFIFICCMVCCDLFMSVSPFEKSRLLKEFFSFLKFKFMWNKHDF